MESNERSEERGETHLRFGGRGKCGSPPATASLTDFGKWGEEAEEGEEEGALMSSACDNDLAKQGDGGRRIDVEGKAE